ncbi:DNA-packaging protein FI [Scandinavium manionii]|uniref:DNA-packaging protein FI n=1 Tax=Scandinavium manionii TaxID=2926520 RepID=UPI002165784C|nr:DNA-packaging protein FI [Scandinavium manionii]MCS2168034.1 DNA-packaging protein FI [Scandinavium manionii]
MSEKTDLLKALAELAVKLDRNPPVDGTVAELKVLRTEWTAEVTALDEPNEPDEPGKTSVSLVPTAPDTTAKKPEVPVASDNDEQLVRFVAVVTLHVNAVDDDGNLQPVVVAGTTARLPAKVFSALRDKRLVKGV